MFGQHLKKHPKTAKLLKIGGIFMLIFNTLGCFFIMLHPKRWKNYLSGQRREINELSKGEENFNRFSKDSGALIRDFFIPSDRNGNKPKALRPKSLAAYAITAVVVKLAVTGFLFFSYPTTAQLSAIVSANMISLSNQARVEAGVPALNENVDLDKFAAQKGADMISRDYFAHNTPEGKRPWQWISKGDYDYVYAGENLAMDFTTAEAVQAAFMKSPSHRQNILNPKYKDIGMAVLSGKINGHTTTLLVEFFGTQRKDVASLALPQPTQPVAKQTVSAIKPASKTSVAVKPQATGVSVGPVNQAVDISLQPQAAGVNNEAIIMVPDQSDAKSLVDQVIEYSNIFFIAFLFFILISLGINIFIRIQVQHTSVILQSVVVIALLLAMILVKFHFLEQVAPNLLIL